MNAKKQNQVVDAQSDAVYQKVRKLVLTRVEAAVKSGKKIWHGKYGSNTIIDADAPVCCAIGAFACNGGPVVGNESRVYEITAPLLMKAGVSEEDVGFVLDAIEAGFELDCIANYSAKTDASPLVRYLYKYWNEYFELGRDIGRDYAQNKEPEQRIRREYKQLVKRMEDQ